MLLEGLIEATLGSHWIRDKYLFVIEEFSIELRTSYFNMSFTPILKKVSSTLLTASFPMSWVYRNLSAAKLCFDAVIFFENWGKQARKKLDSALIAEYILLLSIRMEYMMMFAIGNVMYKSKLTFIHQLSPQCVAWSEMNENVPLTRKEMLQKKSWGPPNCVLRCPQELRSFCSL